MTRDAGPSVRTPKGVARAGAGRSYAGVGSDWYNFIGQPNTPHNFITAPVTPTRRRSRRIARPLSAWSIGRAAAEELSLSKNTPPAFRRAVLDNMLGACTRSGVVERGQRTSSAALALVRNTRDGSG